MDVVPEQEEGDVWAASDGRSVVERGGCNDIKEKKGWKS